MAVDVVEGGTMSDDRLDVAQTIHDFIWCLDERDYDGVGALFAGDGVWVRGGTPLHGPQAIVAALRERPATLRTRHLASNMVVGVTGEGAHARYYLTVYDAQVEGDGPAAIALPGAIFVCEDDLVRTADGWRFVRRRPRMAFKR